jgi:hypothetical protein
MDSIFDRRKFLPALLTAIAVSFALADTAHASLRGTNAQSHAASLSHVDGDKRLYIVQFTEPPAMALPGVAGRQILTSGLLAGSTETRRFNPDSANVRSYVRKLDFRQNAILQSLGISDTQIYAYRYTFNGLALKLTPAQADTLRLHKQVSRGHYWRDRQRHHAGSPQHG